MSRYLLLLLLCYSLTAHAGPSGRLDVFVSIPPQKFLVERIGGQRVHVNVMLQPGQSPETYDPDPKQLVLLSGAQIYFRIGVPFEHHWMDTMLAQNRSMQVVDCQGAMVSRHDPHIWTDPANVKVMAGLIRDALVKRDPAGAVFYRDNYRLLAADLDRLDRRIGVLLARRRTDYFIVSHDAWSYYARHYGLKQLALESRGREVGPRGMSELVDIARREGIHTIFIQKQHPARMAYTLAHELGARVITIDPLAEDYISNLYHVSTLIAEALR